MKKQLKAFIIDDEEAICFLVSAMLKKKGFKTSYYTQLTGAISKMNDFAPDIVFLDLSLNDGSGFSIVPSIQTNYPEAEIIIISAHSGISEKRQAENLNIKYFIPKPLNQEAIHQILEQIL